MGCAMDYNTMLLLGEMLMVQNRLGKLHVVVVLGKINGCWQLTNSLACYVLGQSNAWRQTWRLVQWYYGKIGNSMRYTVCNLTATHTHTHTHTHTSQYLCCLHWNSWKATYHQRSYLLAVTRLVFRSLREMFSNARKIRVNKPKSLYWFSVCIINTGTYLCDCVDDVVVALSVCRLVY